MDDIERVGREVFERANERPDDPPDGGALALAVAIYGGDVLRISRRAQVDGCTAAINGAPKIVIAPGTVQRQHWAVARMLARLQLAALGERVSESFERELAAYLVAPTEMVVRLLRMGAPIPKMARASVITETCAALRLVETRQADGVVVTPERVHRPRGSTTWVGDDVARRLARSSPRSLRKVRITDEPGRVALYRVS